MASLSERAERDLPRAAADALQRQVLDALRTAVAPQDPSGLMLLQLSPTSFGVRVVVQHGATFERAFTPGRGPLPAGVQDLASEAGVRAALDDQYADAVRQAGGLIDAWAAREGRDYRSTLAPEQCQREQAVLGFQQVCTTCGGRARLQCSACRGHGRVTCPTCNGSRQMRHQDCGGSGSVQCPSCRGTGTREVREFEVTANQGQDTMNQQRQLTRLVPCGCAGGRVPCWCGTGHVPCTACGASGIVNCGRCNASGQVPCDACNATGAVHALGRVVCSVARAAEVTAFSDDAEDRQTIRSRVPFAELGTLMPLALAEQRREELQLTLVYHAQVSRQSVEIQLPGERLVVHGFGPQGRVFDYHDLAGAWLTPDLTNLENAVSEQAPFRRLADGGALAEGITRFLGAELNVRIAGGGPDALREFQQIGLVSPRYVERATRALARALPRLYFAQAMKLALWLPLIALGATLLTWAGVTLWAAHHAHFIPGSRFHLAMIGFVLLSLAWGLIELRVGAGLRRLLGAPLYARVASGFGAPRWRARLLAAVLLLPLAWVYGYLPATIHHLLYGW